jgi:hypothetical protein
MFRKLKKKGYYFIIDALIGSTIIFVSLLIILNGGAKPTKIQYNYEMAEEYSTYVLTTKIQDLSNPYVDQLKADKNITDQSLTIMEQVDLFYYKGDIDHARKMIENITYSLIPEKYGFSYSIIEISPTTNTTNIYNNTNNVAVDINNAKVVIASRKITFLQINSSTMFGPALTEIKIWI